ncbi:hypothetical protein BDY21DRAFT_191050 [Lineolata rhizophorae]|uniref:Uncharacterized protein n=1 Tax=Lineolata rhizophorae TaxID=578093 RepID=A0A6A6P6U0_9PEZI|nr:hypothetical protein BDY21DRAFT_191050 [Lineolata rhizophorae]
MASKLPRRALVEPRPGLLPGSGWAIACVQPLLLSSRVTSTFNCPSISFLPFSTPGRFLFYLVLLPPDFQVGFRSVWSLLYPFPPSGQSYIFFFSNGEQGLVSKNGRGGCGWKKGVAGMGGAFSRVLVVGSSVGRLGMRHERERAKFTMHDTWGFIFFNFYRFCPTSLLLLLSCLLWALLVFSMSATVSTLTNLSVVACVFFCFASFFPTLSPFAMAGTTRLPIAGLSALVQMLGVAGLTVPCSVKYWGLEGSDREAIG